MHGVGGAAWVRQVFSHHPSVRIRASRALLRDPFGPESAEATVVRGYRRDSGEGDDAHEDACVHGGGSACDAVNMRDVLSAGNEAQCVFARVCVGRAYLCLRTAHKS